MISADDIKKQVSDIKDSLSGGDSKLFQDDYDFKELNNEFLHRPAAITIRKPFINKSEMSDILLRTLRNYVPPDYVGSKRLPNFSAGLRCRAVAIMYHTVDYDKLQEIFNTYVSMSDAKRGEKWNELVKIAREAFEDELSYISTLEPLVLGFDDNIILRKGSADTVQPTDDFWNSDRLLGRNLKAMIRLTGGTRISTKYVEQSAQPQRVDYEYAESEEQPFQKAFRRHLIVYVLDELDHRNLAPTGDKETGYYSQSPRLLANSYLFYDNRMPFCKGYYGTSMDKVIMYNPKTKTGDHGRITEDFIRKHFGVVNYPIQAYKWVFDVPYGVTAHIVREKSFNDHSLDFADKLVFVQIEKYVNALLSREQLNDAYKKKLSSAMGKLRNAKQHTERYAAAQDLSALAEQAAGIFISTKLNYIQPVNEAIKNGTRMPTTLQDHARMSYEVEGDSGVIISAYLTKWIHNIFSEEKVDNNGYTKVALFPEAQSLKEAVDKYLMEVNNDTVSFINTSFASGATYKQGIPFFDYSEQFSKARHTNRKEVINQGVSRSCVTSKTAVNMPLIDFRVRYYAILLKKIKERINEFRYFIDGTNKDDDNIKVSGHPIQIPTLSDYLWCQETLTKAQLENPSVLDDDTVAGVGTGVLEYFRTKQTDAGTPLNIEFVTRMERMLFSDIGGFFITSISTDTDSVKAPMWNSDPTADDFYVPDNTASASTKLVDTAKKVASKIGLSQLDTVVDSISSAAGSASVDTDVSAVLTKAAAKCNNKDVAGITVSRVIQGISRAHIILKNDKEKYNFPRTDAFNRVRTVIEPMDEIVIYLPDMDGKLRQVFGGFISKVDASNEGGFHEIGIDANCNLQYLQLNRTNIKPSTSRQESENNPLTPFTVPVKMYSSIENFLPMMYAQSLTYYECMPAALPEAPNDGSAAKQLFTIRPAQILEKVQMPIYVSQNVQKLKEAEKEETSKMTVVEEDNNILNMESTAVTNTLADPAKDIEVRGVSVRKVENVETEDKYVEAVDGYIYQYKVSEQLVSLGTYDQIVFNDPLFNYLWYTSASRYPHNEAIFIEENIESLLNDYVYTSITKFKNTGTGAERKLVSGVVSLHDQLKDGARCSYIIFKQRHAGTLTGETSVATVSDKVSLQFSKTVNAVTDKLSLLNLGGDGKLNVTGASRVTSTVSNKNYAEDRTIAAIIDGTSQPSYVLQGLGMSIQFSSWKTNLEIINETADKLNFLCYTTNAGVVRFAPYNFDLLSLNTRDFADTKINTGAMLLRRASNTIDADPNPLILKRKYITEYSRTDDESSIINWLRLSGNWVIGGAQDLCQAIVTNPMLVSKFGVRAGQNRTVIGINNVDSLRLYGLSWMDRQNKRYRSATISGIYDSRMEINKPYYVPHDEVIYLGESIQINYQPGETCTYTLGCSYGKKPLVRVENYVGSYKQLSSNAKKVDQYVFNGDARLLDYVSLSNDIDTLFLDKNAMAPTVYAQYKHMFYLGSDIETVSVNDLYGDPVETSYYSYSSDDELLDKVQQATRNAALCCYNGYLWDNVSGISFEELVYNYGWLCAGRNISGFMTSVALTNELQTKLTDVFKSREAYELFNDDKLKEVFNLTFIHTPAIQDANKIPDFFDHKSYIFTDLAVQSLVKPNAAQLYLQ